jgi:hypothetical protein
MSCETDLFIELGYEFFHVFPELWLQEVEELLPAFDGIDDHHFALNHSLNEVRLTDVLKLSILEDNYVYDELSELIDENLI